MLAFRAKRLVFTVVFFPFHLHHSLDSFTSLVEHDIPFPSAGICSKELLIPLLLQAVNDVLWTQISKDPIRDQHDDLQHEGPAPQVQQRDPFNERFFLLGEVEVPVDNSLIKAFVYV